MSNDIDKIESAMNTKRVKTFCEKCDTQQSISTQPFVLPVGINGDVGQTVNVSALVCSNCGHIDLFSDQLLGV